MKCQNFAGREYVVGLVWAPLPGDNIAIEARDISRERKLKFGVVREQALQVGMTDDKRASGKPSAAALLAETHATAIAIVEIDLDHYWLCAVAQHAVLPGFDVLGGLQSTRDAVLEVISDFDTDDLVVYSDDATLSLLGLDLQPLGSAYDFFSANSDRLTKQQNVGALEKFPLKLFAMFALVISMGGGAYFYLDDSAPATILDEAQIQLPDGKARDISDIVNNAKADEERILKAAREEEIRWLASDLSNLSLARRASALAGDFAAQPSHIGGWTVTSMVFASDDPSRLQLSFEREPIGSAQSLIESLAGSAPVFALDGKKAGALRDISYNNAIMIADPLSFIAETTGIRIKMMDALNASGAVWAFNSKSGAKRRERIQLVLDKERSEHPQLELRQIEFSIAGASLPTLQRLSANVADSWPVIVKKITYTPEAGKFDLVGEFYE